MATVKIPTYEADSKGRLVIPKDPDATLDYSFDWSAWLPESDSIVSAIFVVEAPLVLVGSVQIDPVNWIVTGFVSGGVVPTTAADPLRITCRVTTAEGRIDDRSVFVKIIQR